MSMSLSKIVIIPITLYTNPPIQHSKKKKKKESVEGLYLEDKFSFSLVYISKVQILHKLHFINHYLTYQFIEILSIEDCWQNGPGKSSPPLQCDFPMLFTKKWDLFCFPSHLDLDIWLFWPMSYSKMMDEQRLGMCLHTMTCPLLLLGILRSLSEEAQAAKTTERRHETPLTDSLLNTSHVHKTTLTILLQLSPADWRFRSESRQYQGKNHPAEAKPNCQSATNNALIPDYCFSRKKLIQEC